jgi:hypothetical protein
MEEKITPERIANAIMQDRTFKGYYILVEGIKDAKLYRKFVSKQNFRIKESFGCGNLLKAFEILCARGFGQKIGIIDRDFHDILNTHPQIENIFLTDFHDIEVMIFSTKSYDDVLNIYTIPEKIEKFEKKKGQTIKEIILELSTRIGKLKLADRKFQLGLVFKPDQPDGNQIKYRDFIDDNLSFLGERKMIESIINYSRNKSENLKDFETIHKKYTEMEKDIHDPFQLSNGHDISNITFILLKKQLRSTNPMLNNYRCIEDSLILAYDFDYFKTTQLYFDLKKFSEKVKLSLFTRN